MALLSALATEIVIPVCALVGIAYSYYLARRFLKSRNSDELDHEEQGLGGVRARCAQIKLQLSKGVKAFLFTECWYGGVFMVAFAILIFLCHGSVEGFSTQSQPCRLDPSNMCRPALATAVFSAVSFLLGAFTSVLSGFLGMQIAIYANANTALEEKKGVGKAFFSAFRSGAVMGFLLAANGLLMLYIAINLFKLYYGNDWEGLYEAIAGYGLGGSYMALFGRAAGGIYAKAADVCCHLVKETSPDFLADDLLPAVISYYVGDIVGDIAGAGTDLFGSYAESSCAALVVASISSFGNDHDFTAMCYPLLISSMGILVCLITTLFTANFSKIKEVKEIKPALRKQLIISTILMTFGIAIVSWVALPSSFAIYNFGSQKVVKNWQLGLCVGVGLWAGLLIGLVPKYSTKKASSSVLDVAADNVNAGLAFVNIPFFAAICFLVSSIFAVTYGIAVAALGMLSTIATRLAIDAYSPISDSSQRIAEKATGIVLDADGNTRAAIGKGFAIESAALVSIALFGAFVSRVAISPTDVPTRKFFIGLIVGGVLPYKFFAMTTKSVGIAGSKMAQHCLAQKGLNCIDHAKYVKISTDPVIREMIRPFALVMLTPLIVGTFFGVEMLSGVLAGSLTSVVKIAISASNTGGAWERALKYIKDGALEYVQPRASLSPSATLSPLYGSPSASPSPSARSSPSARLGSKIKQEVAVAIRGFVSPIVQRLVATIERGEFTGDPLKDPSGPALNILIQLMVVESLVFARFFTTHGGLLFKIF